VEKLALAYGSFQLDVRKENSESDLLALAI
jgi:hypothetical protein